MNRNILAGFILIVLFALTIQFQVYATPQQKVYVDPEDNLFSTDDTSLGQQFTINISVADWVDPGLWGHQMSLYYDTDLLNATSASIPDDHFLVPEDPEAAWLEMVKGRIYEDEGYVEFAGTMTSPEPGHTGGGVLATITFEITKEPTLATPVSCTLDLVVEYLLEGGTGNEIPPDAYVVEDGYYEFAAPKPPSPSLEVEPEVVEAAEIGDEVTIDITIDEVEETLSLVGVEFKLRYNTTLLETREEWITEGGFMKSFGGTDFNVTVELDYVLVNITLQTEEPPFPSGSGTLTTIKFNATYIPENLTTSDLLLEDVVLLDVEGNAIPPDQVNSGLYRVPVVIEVIPEDLNNDRKIDILDLGAFALAFGSYPGHPRWNPKADINGDGVANILDAILIAQKFGLEY